MTVNRHWSGTLEHPSLSDLLVKLISHQLGVPYAYADRTAQIVDQRLNKRWIVAG
jgi:hypothetical protein